MGVVLQCSPPEGTCVIAGSKKLFPGCLRHKFHDATITTAAVPVGYNFIKFIGNGREQFRMMKKQYHLCKGSCQIIYSYSPLSAHEQYIRLTPDSSTCRGFQTPSNAPVVCTSMQNALLIFAQFQFCHAHSHPPLPPSIPPASGSKPSVAVASSELFSSTRGGAGLINCPPTPRSSGTMPLTSS